MAIKFIKGNLLEADVEALVNTVNCVGIMGKGIALQFKQTFPENFIEYSKACRSNQVQLGRMFTVLLNSFINPKYIINFPTKQHWKERSRLNNIRTGLESLVAEVENLNIKSIAIPPLGCGNGGLRWDEVRPIIESAFKGLDGIEVYVYEPSGNPDLNTLRVGTKQPLLTRARALLLALMAQYSVPGYDTTMLEVQKLAYFLQEAGEPLRLDFTKAKYGPYADNLYHVLQKLEGHYLVGAGDGSRAVNIRLSLKPGINDEVEDFLASEEGAMQRLDRVANLITGFETPYGMELLSTVHWVVKENPKIANEGEEVIKAVCNWSERKAKLFKDKHIKTALKQLQERQFLTIAGGI